VEKSNKKGGLEEKQTQSRTREGSGTRQKTTSGFLRFLKTLI